MNYLDDLKLKVGEKVTVGKTKPEEGLFFEIKKDYIKFNDVKIVDSTKVLDYAQEDKVYFYETKQGLEKQKGERLFPMRWLYPFNEKAEVAATFLARLGYHTIFTNNCNVSKTIELFKLNTNAQTNEL